MKTRLILTCLTLLSGLILSGAAFAKPLMALSDPDAAVKLTENGTSKEFKIERGGNDIDKIVNVKIKFKADAKFGQDFTANPIATALIVGGSSGGLVDTPVTLNVPDNFIIVTMPAFSQYALVTLEPIDDLIDEGDNFTKETLEIELAKDDGDTDDYGRGYIKKIQTHVLDNDTAAIVISDKSGTTTSESGDTMTFKVSLATQPTKAVEVTIESSDTTEGIAAPLTLTFNPEGAGLWSDKQTVTVTGQPDDNDSSGSTNYNIIVKGPEDQKNNEDIYKKLADQSFLLSNTDVAGLPGKISTDATYSVNEGLGTVQVRATRFGGSTGVATVEYRTIAGNPATANDDYTPITGTFTWTGGVEGEQTVNIPINNDNIVEPSETFIFELFDPTGASIEDAQGTVTITDDDDPGEIAIDPASITMGVGEAAGTATVTVIRTGDNAGEVSASYTTANGTAKDEITDDDYKAKAGSVTFAADSSTPQTIVITIVNDLEDESNEDFTVTLSTPTGDATLGAAVSTVTIEDNDTVGDITIDPASYTVNEGVVSGVVDIIVERTGGTDGTIDATVNTVNGDADAGSDFTGISNGPLHFDDGQSQATITVSITDDIDVEESQNFTVVISNVTDDGNKATIGNNTATVTITDNDNVGALSIVPASYTVSESGTASITVTRTGGTSGILSATVNTVNGDAEAGTDFTGISGGTVTFGDGIGDPDTQTISVSITPDNDDEGDEDFQVVISDATDNATIINNTATVTITNDDDAGVISIDPASYTVLEDVGSASVTIKRTAPADGDVTVIFNTVDGTAKDENSDNDYTAVSNQLVTFLDGDLEETILIPINDDAVVEGPQSFSVTISGETNGATLGNAIGTVTITDNESADGGTFTIDPASISVNEGDGTATVTVRRIGGSTDAAFVDYNTINGSAEDENTLNDYTSKSGQLTWLGGDSVEQMISIVINDDGIAEDAENFVVYLSQVTSDGPSTVGLDVDTGTVTINASDKPGAISIESATYSVAEAGTMVTIVVTRTDGANGIVGATVSTADIASEATAGADYTAFSDTISFADGVTDNQTVNILITDDSAEEGDEDFAVNLTLLTGGATPGDFTSSTVTIVDDDSAGVIAIKSATYGVAENAGTVTIAFTRTGGFDGVIGATVSTADIVSEATAGDDYTAFIGTISFGDGSAADQTVNIAITDDELDEPNENFMVNLSLPTGDATLNPAASSATVTITDDDSAGEIAIDPASYTVDEDAGTVSVIVKRTGGTDGAVSVTATTADGDAKDQNSDNDYTGFTNQPVNFADGETQQTISVSIINDTEEEVDESFSVTIANPTNSATLGNASATVTISANDTPGVIQVDPTSVVVNENAGTATVTVTRTGGNIGAASVAYASADGTANSGADYVATAGVLTWIDGNSDSKSISVLIVDDATEEEAEDFTVTLSGATGATLNDTAKVATVTINKSDSLESDKGTVSINPGSYTVDEHAGFVSVLVTRTVGSDEAISADWTTATGTALGSDFTEASGTLDWVDGNAATKVIQIAITDDIDIESLETFTVVLSGLTDEVTAGNLVGTVNIRDNDEPDQGALVPVDVTSVEKDGTVMVTVYRAGGTDGPLDVTWATADNSAISGGLAAVGEDDYVPANGALNWADGENEPKEILVTIKEDTFTETSEVIDVVFDYTDDQTPVQVTSTIEIFDNDSSGELTINDAAVNEESQEVVLTVRRNGSNTGIAFVRYRTVDGTATDQNTDNDYQSQLGSFTWLEGEGCQADVCNNGERQIVIPVSTDFLKEPTEYFTVELFGEQGSDLTAGSITVVKRVGRVDILDPVAIPTLNQWMLLLLALMLGGIGYRQLRQREQI